MEAGKDDLQNGIWYPVQKMSDNIYLMARSSAVGTQYALLVYHEFRFVQPHALVAAERFNLKTNDLESMTMGEKLRYYRHKIGLRQFDVAEHIGIHRSTYFHYEEGKCDYIPSELVDRLSGLFGTEPEEILDEYNRFLYAGQGRQIRELRETNGLGRKQYAVELGISAATLKNWESDRVRIQKSSWERLFKERLQNMAREKDADDM